MTYSSVFLTAPKQDPNNSLRNVKKRFPTPNYKPGLIPRKKNPNLDVQTMNKVTSYHLQKQTMITITILQ